MGMFERTKKIESHNRHSLWTAQIRAMDWQMRVSTVALCMLIANVTFHSVWHGDEQHRGFLSQLFVLDCCTMSVCLCTFLTRSQQSIKRTFARICSCECTHRGDDEAALAEAVTAQRTEQQNANTEMETATTVTSGAHREVELTTVVVAGDDQEMAQRATTRDDQEMDLTKTAADLTTVQAGDDEEDE